MLTHPTIDLDATDIEMFDHAKERVGWNCLVEVRPAGQDLRRADQPRPAVPAAPHNPQKQLSPALDGPATHAYAHSFIVTNIPADAGDAGGLDAWLPPADQHRGPVPRRQAWRRPASPALREGQRQHHLGVGDATRRRPHGHAATTDRLEPRLRDTDPHSDRAPPAASTARPDRAARPRHHPPLVSRGASSFTVDLPDDLVGGLDPRKWLAALVPAVNEHFDDGDEVFH